MVRPRQSEGSQSQPGSLGPTSAVCRAAGAGSVESCENSFSKDDVPRAAGSNTNGLPLAEKAVEPRYERMTGSSDVSSLFCKVGFRVTLFPASDPTQQQAHPELPLDGQKSIFRRWPLRHRIVEQHLLSTILIVGVDGSGVLLVWRGRLLARHPIPYAGFSCQQCGRLAILLPCGSLLWWGSKQALGRDPSIMHSRPRSTLGILLWSLGQAAATSTNAHNHTMRFGIQRALQAWGDAAVRMT